MLSNETWSAISAGASAVSAVIALAVGVVSCQGLDAARASLSVSARNDMIKSVDEAIVRLKADPASAQYFFLVLRNVAENQRQEVLKPTDVAFVMDYLKQQRYLCKNPHLVPEWKRMKQGGVTSSELDVLADAMLNEKLDCRTEGVK